MSEFKEWLTESFSGIFKKGEQDVIVKYKKDEQLVPDKEEDGAIVVNSSASGFFGQYLDLENRTKSDYEYITLVRQLAMEPEFDGAVSEVINELIVIDQDEEPVKIDLGSTELSQPIKDKITKEFDNIITLLDFTAKGYDIMKQWYIDGRLYYHVIIDDNNPKKGIQQLRNIDPRRLKYVKEIEKSKGFGNDDIIVQEKDYFVFNSKGKDSANGIKIHPDRIIYAHSGIKNPQTGAIVSHLNKAIKRFNQLRLLEESVIIYRFSRAPERRVFYIDIGNMPPKKGEKYVQDLMARYRNKVVYDSSTGCFAMNTLIPLLDGRTLSLDEIKMEFDGGKEMWAYSCDPKSGKFAPGLITWAGVTRRDEQVLKITLDNGKEITCTLDHKFPTKDGRKVEAKDLVIGESMIPNYTRKNIMHGTNSNYEQFFDNELEKWIYTHRAVSQWKDKLEIENEWGFNPEFINEEKKTVHHANYNRYDNSPSNLTRMSSLDHFSYHKQHNKNGLNAKSIVSKTNENGDLINEWRHINKSKSIRLWSENSNFSHAHLVKICKILGFNTYREFNKSLSFVNHKIVNIEYIEERIDVGTITIDGKEIYHNHHTFALDAGIYTFNSIREDKKFSSMLEDYWIPKNSAGSGTKIESLSGTQLSNGMDDVDVFRRQFYMSLNVPLSRLEPDSGFSMGRASEISREEVKFGRFCTRLRVKFSDLFDEILLRQLLLKNVMSKEDWFKIKQKVKYKFNTDNHFRELLDQEILSSRLRILQDIEQFTPMQFNKELFPMYSVEWVKKHVLMQTEAEIQEIDVQSKEEMKDIRKLNVLPSQLGLMPDGTPIWQLEQPPPEPAAGGGATPTK